MRDQGVIPVCFPVAQQLEAVAGITQQLAAALEALPAMSSEENHRPLLPQNCVGTYEDIDLGALDIDLEKARNQRCALAEPVNRDESDLEPSTGKRGHGGRGALVQVG